MKILFTGGSSFTGCWFIKELVKAGHEVTAVFTQPDINCYSDIRKERVTLNSSISQQVFDCSFGSDKFISLFKDGNYNLLCHHAADVRDYKSPDFNIYIALESNTYRLQEILSAARSDIFYGVILTGSYFEAEEGIGEDKVLREAFSPYALSKTFTYEYFRYFCFLNGIKLGKFVIPNPFGPLEEPRFTNYLLKTWYAGKIAEVNTPLYIRDNIHSDMLAKAYAKFLVEFTESNTNFLKLNPSGYTESMGEFTSRFSGEMRRRLELPCEFKLNEQKIFSEPLKRINSLPASDYIGTWDESKSWDALAEYYKKRFLQ